MNIFRKLKNIWNAGDNDASSSVKRERSLIGAMQMRCVNWINASLKRINADIDSDLITTITRCRELAKNDPIVRAYLSSCVKNVIGKTGFCLQCGVKNNEDLDEKLNNEIEWKYYLWGKTSNEYLTVDGGMGHNEFDALILRTLLIDGEVFIRIHRNAPNPYGISFEMIDSASIDWTKKREATPNQNAIILGVEVDKFYRPVNYWYKQGDTKIYQTGKLEVIPAKDIIHIFKKEFPQQVRGLPPFNAVINDIKQLQDYRVAELMAAKTAACLSIFYERNNNGQQGMFSGEVEEDNATFIDSIGPGIASVVPNGYNVKSISPTHPTGGYGEFNKSILKQIASSLGVSYAKLLKDYSDVNYSSLREGTIDEASFYSEMQQFLINSWKEKEFKLFIESLVINDSLKASYADNLNIHHTWISQRRHYFDAQKEILGDERAMKLGLKSPIQIMEEDGQDPEDVMKSWRQYKDLCSKYDLNFAVTDEDKMKVEAEVDMDDEKQQDEIINSNRN